MNYTPDDVSKWQEIAAGQAKLYASMSGAHEPWEQLEHILRDYSISNALAQNMEDETPLVWMHKSDVDDLLHEKPWTAGANGQFCQRKGDDYSVPVYLHAKRAPVPVIGVEDWNVLQRLRDALPTVGLNGWLTGVRVLNKLLATAPSQPTHERVFAGTGHLEQTGYIDPSQPEDAQS